jgi:subtilisin family serine protease
LSRSFLSAAENARVQTAFPGAHEIADLHYHGTHVAATVASNGTVGAGVTSGVTLVGLKVCAPGVAPSWRGTCPTSGTLSAILYAADLGIPIINMSLGGGFNRRDASAAGGVGPSFLATINRVFNYANQKGTIIVVSAGNSAIDMDHDGNRYNSYCNSPHVVCVSATGPTAQAGVNGPWTNIDALASYSNFGRSAVSVAAPGGNVSAVWATCSRHSLAIPVCQTGNFIVGLAGTSMAAPHTAGVLALLASEGVSGASKLRARLQQSADDLGAAGTDPAYGKGRINAQRALGL